MRIISGRFKSRQLKATPPRGVRPTSDKLRETLFNVLSTAITDATFLDGCAGMGAIGIEAISRDAAFVYFVDKSRTATRIIKENLQSLDVTEGYKILEMDFPKALDLFVRDGIAFDIAFIDPPYEGGDLYKIAVQKFSSAPLLKTGGLLIIEHSKREDLPESIGTLRKVRSLVQGDSTLAFYRPEEN
jgi:16S rRNA (guanine966-N2)-methyltransferase